VFLLKKGMIILMSAVLMTSLFSGCSNKDNVKDAGAGAKAGEKDKVTLKVFQFKVEIAEAFNRMVKDYEKETGVKVEVETVGGGADYGSALKAKLAAGDEPDIFNNNGFNRLDPYMDRATDLSDQPWVSQVPDFAKQWALRDGKMYGMPMNLEGYGIVYNKDYFKKAGIATPPQTLSELREAMKKLKAAGIQPIANGFGEWWVLAQLSNVATSLHENPIQFIHDVVDKKVKLAEDPVYRDWVNLLNLVLEYTNDNPLTTDYNTQVTLFASGETAMMSQGNWTQVQIDKINPDLNIGLLPLPVNDDPKMAGHILSGVPNNWIVNKKGKHSEEAKKFLNWMVSSSTGKRFLVEEFKFIPAMNNIEYKQGVLGDIAESAIEYIKKDKALPWYTAQWPETYDKEFGAAMQAYVAKKIDSTELLKRFDESIQKLAKK
jgi:raffinose/stachyose/melibiose transport system substrate-binding protein